MLHGTRRGAETSRHRPRRPRRGYPPLRGGRPTGLSANRPRQVPEKKLLEARRDQNLGKPTNGDGYYTPLQTAARHGQDEVVAFLIKTGADVNAADGYGYTPLHLTAERGYLDIVKRLVRAGANVEAKTKAVPGGVVPGAW